MHAGNGLRNLALSPRINILAVVRSENTRPCSYSYHLDFVDDFMASQAEVSLVNKHLHVSCGRVPKAGSRARLTCDSTKWVGTYSIASTMSLLLNQFDGKYVTCIWHHETTYPAVMFYMSVWVCVPCHCVGVALQISGH